MNIFQAIVDGMTWLLNRLYEFSVIIGLPNYGIAIILLTIIIKIALYPLSQKQMKSMMGMQQIQPKIKEIQDKWKNKDPKKMQQLIMELYQEHNVNPAMGCLPLLVQMPILIALYRSLFNFQYADPQSAKFLWIHNLSDRALPFPAFASDPAGFVLSYILPVLAGITTYMQSKMTATTNDPTTKMMTITMPIFITWISATIPAGLALYWVVYNVASIIQQYFVNKQAAAVRGEASGK